MSTVATVGASILSLWLQDSWPVLTRTTQTKTFRILDFHKIGGFLLLTKLLDSGDKGFAWRAGELTAALSQNNAYCQEHLLTSTDLLDRLMRLVASQNEPSVVRVKALYGLSGNCITQLFVCKGIVVYMVFSMCTAFCVRNSEI